MSKIELDHIQADYASKQRHNSNYDAIEAAFDNTVSRDGSTPNYMTVDFDMNSNRIINLPDAASDTEPVSYSQWVAGGSNSPTVVNANLVNFTQTGTGAVSRTVTNKFQDYVNIRDFGAKGDGSTDDTTAIQNALNTGKDVYVPYTSSFYKTTSRVDLLSNQTMFGSGVHSYIKCTGVTTSTIRMSNITNSHIKDMRIAYDGTYSSGTTGAAVLIRGGAAFCSVRGCQFQSVVGSVTINDANDCTIAGNQSTSVTGLTVSTDDNWDFAVWLTGSRNIFFDNRAVGGCGMGIILLDTGASTHVDDNIVFGNYIGTHTKYGIILYETGGTARRNIITHNRITAITGAFDGGGGKGYGMGIYVATAEETVISNNVIDVCNAQTAVESLAPAGIGITDCNNFTCTGNLIFDVSWYGIMVVGNGSVITGRAVIANNHIRAATKGGIYIKNYGKLTVVNNGVVACGDFGIEANLGTNQEGVIIEGNNVYGNTGVGLYAFGLKNTIIRGNILDSNATNGNFQLNNGLVTGNGFFNSTSTTDVNFDSGCSGTVIFDNNMVLSSATNGVVDGYGVHLGTNNVAGQSQPYGSPNGLAKTLTSSASNSVKGCRLAIIPTSGTAATLFTNGIDGQVLTLEASGNRTITHSSGATNDRVILNGSTDFAMTSSATLTLFKMPSGCWYEMSRKIA